MNLDFLRRFNLNAYDLQALEYLLTAGQAAAAVIACEAEIPTSKIYSALQKLEDLGLVRLENTSPKIYAVVDDTQLLGTLAQLQQEDHSSFSENLQLLSRDIAAVASKRVQGEHAMSFTRNTEEYLEKHLPRVAEARQSVYTAWQHFQGEGQFIDRTYLPMFFGKHGIQHMVLTDLAIEPGHPVAKHVEARLSQRSVGNFHIWDGKYVLLVTGNKYTGAVSSVLVQDSNLYLKLAEGFMLEWFNAETV